MISSIAVIRQLHGLPPQIHDVFVCDHEDDAIEEAAAALQERADESIKKHIEKFPEFASAKFFVRKIESTTKVSI